MKRILIVVCLFVLSCTARLSAQSQYATITSSQPIADTAGNALASGTITFTPVASSGSTATITPNLASTGGRAIPRPVVMKITAGAISPTFGAAKLLDVQLANPSGFCYVTMIHDNNSGATWPADNCLQPTSSANWCSVDGNGNTTCDYSRSVPNGVSQALQVAGPSGMNWRGAWSNTITYNLHDAVSYGGSSYISTLSGNTNTPGGTGWSLLAAQGAAGMGTDPNCHTDGSGNLTCSTVAAGTTYLNSRTIAAADAAMITDYLIRCSGTLTVTLPATPGSSGTKGQLIVIKNVGSGVVTIDGNGHLIDGSAIYTLSTTFGYMPSVTLQYDPASNTWNLI